MDSGTGSLVIVCPNCGRYVDWLSEIEGWCIRCTARAHGQEVGTCADPDCGRVFVYNPKTSGHKYCGKCRYKRSGYQKPRIRCKNCGAKIWARRKSRFCGKPECQLAKARFTKYRAKGFNITDSLHQAVTLYKRKQKESAATRTVDN